MAEAIPEVEQLVGVNGDDAAAEDVVVKSAEAQS
jgi:hypothetical protein